MALNSPHPKIKTPENGINSVYILAQARRNHVNAGTNQVKSQCSTSSSETFKTQDQRNFQICEGGSRHSTKFTTPMQRYLPLNMLISKTATRRNHKDNTNPENKFNLTNLRKVKLLPWSEKESHRKRRHSADLHNKQKIAEIQAMKAKLKFPRYDPNDLLQGRRYRDLQHLLSESQSSPRRENTSPGSLSDGSRRKSIIIQSEDPLIGDDDMGDGEIQFEQSRNEAEGSKSPHAQPVNRRFVFNPVISPVSKRFGNAYEVLKYHCSPQFENSRAKEVLASPGNCTTTSASSGLTVAEETLQFTNYTQKCAAPSNSRSYSRRFSNDDIRFDRSDDLDCDWLPSNLKPDFINFFEE